jgi:Pyruvate/2-oxoacid:ferredoxin oxidoreductase delta subunit
VNITTNKYTKSVPQYRIDAFCLPLLYGFINILKAIDILGLVSWNLTGKDHPMSANDLHMHYVCTHAQAARLIKKHTQFWVSNCGCREGHGGCARSRIDVCLMFKGDAGTSGSGLKALTPPEAQAILTEAKDKNLVARPFRNMKNKRETEGICFCCDDCCGYFLDQNEICDKGTYIERTDEKYCTNCYFCVDVCYFKARQIRDNALMVYRDNCYGCGLCVNSCPEMCIEMVRREK